MRPGGIIAIDNVLLHGRVLREPEADDPPAVAVMRAFNAALARDSRVLPLTLPLGDGLTLLVRQ